MGGIENRSLFWWVCESLGFEESFAAATVASDIDDFVDNEDLSLGSVVGSPAIWVDRKIGCGEMLLPKRPLFRDSSSSASSATARIFSKSDSLIENALLFQPEPLRLEVLRFTLVRETFRIAGFFDILVLTDLVSMFISSLKWESTDVLRL